MILPRGPPDDRRLYGRKLVERCGTVWKVGQCRPGDELVFEETTYGEAAAELRSCGSGRGAGCVADGADVDLAALARGPNQEAAMSV